MKYLKSFLSDVLLMAERKRERERERNQQE